MGAPGQVGGSLQVLFASRVADRLKRPLARHKPVVNSCHRMLNIAVG